MSLQLVKGYMVGVCLHVLFFLVAAVSARCNHHRNCQLNIATPVSCSPFLWSLCRRMTCRKNRSTCGDGPSATSLGGTSHLSPGNSRDDSHPPSIQTGLLVAKAAFGGPGHQVSTGASARRRTSPPGQVATEQPAGSNPSRGSSLPPPPPQSLQRQSWNGVIALDGHNHSLNMLLDGDPMLPLSTLKK